MATFSCCRRDTNVPDYYDITHQVFYKEDGYWRCDNIYARTKPGTNIVVDEEED